MNEIEQNQALQYIMMYNKIFDYKSLFKKEESLDNIHQMFQNLNLVQAEESRIQNVRKLREQLNKM
jgi:hypothetical protein